MNNIKDFKNLNQKKILLRLDLNVPLKKGLIADETRIDKILPTIKFLLQENSKILIISHVGRPKGKIIKRYDKIHMFDVNISEKETHRESNTFRAGKNIALLNLNNIKIGFTICYDLRFPNLFRKLAKKGSEVILMPAAFTVPSGKAHWEIMIRSRAIENSLFVIGTNMCGTHHNNRKTYGHSILVDPWGKIIAKAMSKPLILNSEINLDEVRDVRKKIPAILYD